MEPLLLAVAPILVFIVTSGVKRLKAVSLLEGGRRVLVLRFLVAVLSFGAVAGKSLVDGSDVDPVAVDSFVEAAIVFASASGLHLFAAKK